MVPMNLTSFGLQPAGRRRADASTPHPDDMSLSLSVAGPIQGALSVDIVQGLCKKVPSEKKAFRVQLDLKILALEASALNGEVMRTMARRGRAQPDGCGIGRWARRGKPGPSGAAARPPRVDFHSPPDGSASVMVRDERCRGAASRRSIYDTADHHHVRLPSRGYHFDKTREHIRPRPRPSQASANPAVLALPPIGCKMGPSEASGATRRRS